MAFANSKTEDYVRKVNRLYDIYLERELHHLEDERKFYLKTFRSEYRAAREKRDKITSKAKEYRRLQVMKSQEISPVERSATGTKQAVFITETGLEKCEVQLWKFNRCFLATLSVNLIFDSFEITISLALVVDCMKREKTCSLSFRFQQRFSSESSETLAVSSAYIDSRNLATTILFNI